MNRILIFIMVLALLLSGCAHSGKSPDQQRQAIQSMKNDVLTELFKLKPGVKAQIENAEGYGVFSNANINLVLASFGGGYGLVKNNSSGKYTYMKMGEVGIGLGVGAKDFRIVFVFHTKESMEQFVEKGWAAGVQADAAAKAGEKGAAVGGELTVDNMTVYQITEAGLALQATVKGTKYWKDALLN